MSNEEQVEAFATELLELIRTRAANRCAFVVMLQTPNQQVYLSSNTKKDHMVGLLKHALGQLDSGDFSKTELGGASE